MRARSPTSRLTPRRRAERAPRRGRRLRPRPKRKRRRVFRKGTAAAETAAETDGTEPGAALGRSSDELDLGWGERPSGSGLGDRWLQEQRPPHYE